MAQQLHWIPTTRPASFFATASGGIGWGLPAAVGLALGDRARGVKRTVVATIGDGSAQYSVQAMYTAAQHRLPAIYPLRSFAVSGGLASYGINPIQAHRQIAFYVDRILRGTKPEELPIQAPNRFELIINLKTAKALGLTIPQPLLQRADEVIE